MRFSFLALSCVLLSSSSSSSSSNNVVTGFSPISQQQQQQSLQRQAVTTTSTTSTSTSLNVARYGPTDAFPTGMNDDDNDNQKEKNSNNDKNGFQYDYEEDPQQELARNKQAFRSFLEQAIEASTVPDHLPRLLANNIDLIMSLHSEDGTTVISEVLQHTKDNGTDEELQIVSQVIDVVLSFAEELVDQAMDMDDHNKKLLGKIIKTMATKTDALGAPIVTATTTSLEREDALDKLMKEERMNFTPGFLRHVEGECNRISNAPRMSPESSRLLEILRIIQTRVLEELGKDIGEAALVLGQLLGYDETDEMLGVLEAGLTVRGREFAMEMVGMTEEALDGFQRVPGGTDAELVERVTMIDHRLREFLEESNKFQ